MRGARVERDARLGVTARNPFKRTAREVKRMGMDRETIVMCTVTGALLGAVSGHYYAGRHEYMTGEHSFLHAGVRIVGATGLGALMGAMAGPIGMLVLPLATISDRFAWKDAQTAMDNTVHMVLEAPKPAPAVANVVERHQAN